MKKVREWIMRWKNQIAVWCGIPEISEEFKDYTFTIRLQWFLEKICRLPFPIAAKIVQKYIFACSYVLPSLNFWHRKMTFKERLSLQWSHTKLIFTKCTKDSPFVCLFVVAVMEAMYRIIANRSWVEFGIIIFGIVLLFCSKWISIRKKFEEEHDLLDEIIRLSEEGSCLRKVAKEYEQVKDKKASIKLEQYLMEEKIKEKQKQEKLAQK